MMSGPGSKNLKDAQISLHVKETLKLAPNEPWVGYRVLHSFETLLNKLQSFYDLFDTELNDYQFKDEYTQQERKINFDLIRGSCESAYNVLTKEQDPLEAEKSIRQFVGIIQDEMHNIQHKPNLMAHEILFTEADLVAFQCDNFGDTFLCRNSFNEERAVNCDLIQQKMADLFQPHSIWVNNEVLEKNTLLINHFKNFHQAYSKDASKRFDEIGNQVHFLEIQKSLLDAMMVLFAKNPPASLDQVEASIGNGISAQLTEILKKKRGKKTFYDFVEDWKKADKLKSEFISFLNKHFTKYLSEQKIKKIDNGSQKDNLLKETQALTAVDEKKEMLRKINFLGKAAIRELSFKQKVIETGGKMVSKHPVKTTVGVMSGLFGGGMLAEKYTDDIHKTAQPIMEGEVSLSTILEIAFFTMSSLLLFYALYNSWLRVKESSTPKPGNEPEKKSSTISRQWLFGIKPKKLIAQPDLEACRPINEDFDEGETNTLLATQRNYFGKK